MIFQPITIETLKAGSVSEQLKMHCLRNHQEVEKSIIGLIKNSSSVADYIRLLHIFYGFFSALENQIQPFIGPDLLPDISFRRKSDLLKADIISLGAKYSEDLSHVSLPEIDNPMKAFGALYVMEGSTLGGVHIAAMLEKKLEIPQHSLRFFRGYGSQTASMWENFRTVLNGLPENEQHVCEIMTAADQTFNKFSEWISYRAVH